KIRAHHRSKLSHPRLTHFRRIPFPHTSPLLPFWARCRHREQIEGGLGPCRLLLCVASARPCRSDGRPSHGGDGPTPWEG
ncbi:Os10g0135700, partial [Oryza sativa Japonica Group]